MSKERLVIDSLSSFCTSSCSNLDAKIFIVLYSYIAHSSFIVIFPAHFLYLILTSRRPIKFYISSLKAALINRLSPRDVNRSEKAQFPTARFFGLSLAFATGLNIPGLLWYASVSLSS